MKHLTEEQIVLHCFGDAGDGMEIDRHLAECPECREAFSQVKALLASIEPTPVPEPHAGLEEEMWLRLRGRLPQSKAGLRQRFFSLHFPQAGWAAVAVLVAAAFLAGHFWPHGSERPNAVQSAQIDPQRVVLVAVGDHLEQSQILLIEVMHTDAKNGLDLSREQGQARDLLDANRLYRLSAQSTGDPSIGRMLDQLEPVLAEIANAPRDLNQQDLQEIQNQVQSQSLLFKIRVIGLKVRQERNSLPQYSGNQRL